MDTGWRQVVGAGLVALVVAWFSIVQIASSTPSVVGARARGVPGPGFTSDFDGDGFADVAVGVERDDVKGIRNAGTVSVLYGSAVGVSARNQLWSQDSPDIKDRAQADDEFGWAVATGDFNGDGFADLAVGVTTEDVGGVGNAGAVNVLYGSPQGLSAVGNQFWHQGSPGIVENPEFLDSFGWALAAGDFNGDGYADLAVGVPGESNREFNAHGGVNVLYGSPNGLTAAGNQYWDQDSPGIADQAEAGDKFGLSVRAGDYNGDGYMDLAIGVPSENGAAGAMHVLYGSPAGLTATGSQFWSQDSPGILDTAESFDYFGVAIASGDINGDGFADVAVGVAGEGIGIGPIRYEGRSMCCTGPPAASRRRATSSGTRIVPESGMRQSTMIFLGPV